VPEAAEGDIDAAVTAAWAAFDEPAGWAGWDAARRGHALERLAVTLEKRGEQFAQLVSSQNGMPISIGRMSEAVTGHMLLRYFAALAQQAPAEESRPSLVGGTTVVRREPIGVVAAIVPWNFPQSLTLLQARAGRDVGGHLVRHPGVDKVAFTGSTAAVSGPATRREAWTSPAECRPAASASTGTRSTPVRRSAGSRPAGWAVSWDPKAWPRSSSCSPSSCRYSAEPSSVEAISSPPTCP
jgi:acyl-CoA reductase-like NAD-dependent aldehyde dehydrogenase